MASGSARSFVYRGKLLPAIARQIYLHGAVQQGGCPYTDLDAMLAVHGVRGKAAPIHEIQVMYQSPGPGHGVVKRRMYDIVAEAFANKWRHLGAWRNAGRLFPSRGFIVVRTGRVIWPTMPSIRHWPILMA